MRFARQQTIPGWIQTRLTLARVLVIGSGKLAQLVAVGLAGLGVGTIRVMDSARPARAEDGWLLRLDSSGSATQAETLARLVQVINPEISASFYPSAVLYEECLQAYPRPSAIVEASADASSKWACLQFGRRSAVPVIFAGAGPADARLAVWAPGQQPVLAEEGYVMPKYDGRPQGTVTSLGIAGLALEEARKSLLRLNEEDKPLDHELIYNRQSANRFDGEKHFAISADADYGGHVVMIGAGAIANFLALALGSVSKLTVIDFDRVDPTNLNRQLLFYDAVSEYKATALVAKLRKVNPDIEYEAIVARVDAEFLRRFLRRAEPAVDLICSAVDNFETRLLLHRAALEARIPLLNGGVSAFGGRVALYYPGRSACLQCQLDLETWARWEREQEIPRQGCARVPESSVVMSNMVIASMMAGEAGTVLNSEAFGPSIKGVIEYSALDPARIGVRSIKEPCHCQEKLQTPAAAPIAGVKEL